MGEWSSLSDRFGWKYIVSFIGGFCVGALLIFVLIDKGSGRTFEFNFDQGVKVTVEPETKKLADLLPEELKRNREKTENFLETHGYFRPSSDRLLDRLLHMEPTHEEGKKVATRLRKMLANLQGSFKLPGTLQEVDEKFMQALEQLDKTTIATKKTNALIAKLWEESLAQRGVFRRRRFPATVELLTEVPNDKPRVFACPDSALSRGLIVDIFTDHGSTGAPIEHNAKAFDCKKAVQTGELLTEQATVQFGLNRVAYEQLYPKRQQDLTSSPKNIRFMIYPNQFDTTMSTGGYQ
ncbi:MAG: hypothetical protein OXK82_03155 [Deltaproteobacteria bacterium]|nr:hypothetical protein [Deltaproteobacteria bacterium]